MAKKATEPKRTLSELVPIYGTIKAELDRNKKMEASLNKEIKELFVKEGKDTINTGVWKADYSVRVSDVYDEDAVLEYALKHKAFADCIKTKQYVDFDALEQLIYTGKIPQKQVAALDEFRSQKETKVLKVTKIGE